VDPNTEELILKLLGPVAETWLATTARARLSDGRNNPESRSLRTMPSGAKNGSMRLILNRLQCWYVSGSDAYPGLVIGVIEVINKKMARRSHFLIRVLTAFTSQATIAIENARPAMTDQPWQPLSRTMMQRSIVN
jgi:hypothetical protein